VDEKLGKMLVQSVPLLPVHNSSSKRSLTPVAFLVLGLGLKFIPHALFSSDELRREIDRAFDGLQRRLKLAFYFEGGFNPDPFIPSDTHKKPWDPPPSYCWPSETRPYATIIEQVTAEARRNAKRVVGRLRQSYSQLDRRLIEILTELANDEDIVIMAADKNLGVVVMDREDYVEMCQSHLSDENTYQPTEYNRQTMYESLAKILKDHGRLHDERGKLSKLAASLMQIRVEDLRPASFYCLPKIHKWKPPAKCPGRPIASTIGTHSEAASKFLDRKLRCLLDYLKRTVCSSSQELILAIAALNEDIREGKAPSLTGEFILFCADVSALYPSIPLEFGLARVREMCERSKIFPQAEINFLMDLLRWVLSTYVVECDGVTYLQVKGTAMGTPVAVMYAVIVMCSMEQQDGLTDQMLFYTRFIDDCFAICTREQAENFVRSFQHICPDIQFDAQSITIDKKGVMLDVELFIREDGTIGHKIFQKPLNIYQYIPPLSAHSEHVFPALVLNEFKRYRLMCTSDADYEEQVSRFYARLMNRGYTSDMIHEARVQVPSRDELMERLKASVVRKETAKHEARRREKLRPVLSSCLPVFSVPFNLASLVRLPPALTSSKRYKEVFAEGPVLNAHKNLPSVRKYLANSRFLGK
jgi:hypothetical protein